MRDLPLEGVTVLDLTRNVSGPFATRALASSAPTWSRSN